MGYDDENEEFVRVLIARVCIWRVVGRGEFRELITLIVLFYGFFLQMFIFEATYDQSYSMEISVADFRKKKKK